MNSVKSDWQTWQFLWSCVGLSDSLSPFCELLLWWPSQPQSCPEPSELSDSEALAIVA